MCSSGDRLQYVPCALTLRPTSVLLYQRAINFTYGGVGLLKAQLMHPVLGAPT